MGATSQDGLSLLPPLPDPHPAGFSRALSPIFPPALSSPHLLPAFSPFSPSLTGVSHGSQGAQMKMELASLAPLQVPRVAVPRDRPGEALPTQTL